jgi:hypothetical protein
MKKEQIKLVIRTGLKAGFNPQPDPPKVPGGAS